MPIDYIGHYMAAKQEGTTEVDMEQMINAIVAYIQNHEVYFTYEPQFFEGVLIFNVVGYKRDHILFTKAMEQILEHFGCKLGTLLPLKRIH
jgi:hypothetical protein